MAVGTSPAGGRWKKVAVITLGLVVGGAMSTAGVGLAAKFITVKKANKQLLGNTSIARVSGSVAGGSQTTAVSVFCPSGLQAVGGGLESPSQLGTTGSATIIFESRPIVSGQTSIGWYVEIQPAGGGGSNIDYTATAVCSR